MKGLFLVAIILTFMGCSVPYTKTRYSMEVYPAAVNEFKKTLREDDSLMVCLNMEYDDLTMEFSNLLTKCMTEEYDKRPYEFSRSTAMAYVEADAVCVRYYLVEKYKDAVDYDSVPSKYKKFCTEYFDLETK